MNASNTGQMATAGTDGGSALLLRIGDLTIAVPPDLSAITTYVLLEQEEWFEKEIGFLPGFLRAGMNAIDIGANLGLYSLPMARLVGPDGRVFAYEPGAAARALLKESRTLNDLGNLEIIGMALSDGARDGHLSFASSSELRALDTGGDGEAVRITSLDLECAAWGWPPIDFMKIDAEGEEERIIAGGRKFFADQSPLIMFEVKAVDKINSRLLSLFPAIGYRVFRQLGGAGVLVPLDAAQPFDAFELNLFAAKPDCVASLAERGLLVEAIPSWSPGEDDRRHAVSFWRNQGFASLESMPAQLSVSVDAEYEDAMAAYAVWRDGDRPLPIRCAALAFALRGLRAVNARAGTATRLSTWARVASEWGARAESVFALEKLIQIPQIAFAEPFWPARARFDALAMGARPAEWLAVAAAEQLERSSHFSTGFGNGSAVLTWVCRQPLASAEMVRRSILIAARSGAHPAVPERLLAAAPDHRNAEIWRRGMVPGTVVAIIAP